MSTDSVRVERQAERIGDLSSGDGQGSRSGWKYLALFLVVCAVVAGLAWGVDRLSTLNTVAADTAEAMNAKALAAVLQVEADKEAEATAKRTTFIGDSYTTGTGASDPSKRWTAIVSKAQGWHQVNLGHGGTGYLKASTSGCGSTGCPNFASMVQEAVATKPGRVVVTGGVSDFTSDIGEVEPMIQKTYADLRAALPTTTIIAIGPPVIGDATPKAADFDAAVRRAAESIGAQYISLADPDVLDESMTMFGNTQLNDAGHAAVAQRVLEALPPVTSN